MNTVASGDPRIQKVRITKDRIIVDLLDGRVVSVPLAWSWRLSEATPAQRANFRLIGSGQGVHWPELDEDISVEGLLHGTPARRPTPPAAAREVRSAAPPTRRAQPARHTPARG
ncbi:MAG: DUF2442 domain-containing protein [Bryobacteraceae bacterium]|jgi:hypothetical protein